MKYSWLLYNEEKSLGPVSKSELDALVGEHLAYAEVFRKRRHLLRGDALRSLQAPTTARVRKGRCRPPTVLRRDEVASWVGLTSSMPGPGRRHPGGLEGPVGASRERRGAAHRS
jgi:hypothetical protein